MYQLAKKKFNGFTLVELIIVITILAILATTAFISFQGYTKDARDGIRMSDIKQIYNGLSIYKTQTEKTLLPDNYISIQSGTTVVSYQGYAGASVLRTLKISGGKDPGTKDYYIYTTDVNSKKAQLMTYMETSDKDVQLLSQLNKLNIINQAQAVTNSGYYQDKKIYLYGDKIGILTDSNKVPLQETTTNTGIDITTLTGNITTYFGGNTYSGGVSTSTGLTLVNQINSQITNSTICDPGYSLIGGVCTLVNYFTGSGTSVNPYRINGVGLSDTTTIATSCNYYNLNATTNTGGSLRGNGTCGNGSQGCLSNGVYLIDPDGNGGVNAFQAYCDMSTDGGGYTLVAESKQSSGTPSSGTSQGTLNLNETNISTTAKFSDTIINLIGINKTYLLKCQRNSVSMPMTINKILRFTTTRDWNTTTTNQSQIIVGTTISNILSILGVSGTISGTFWSQGQYAIDLGDSTQNNGRAFMHGSNTGPYCGEGHNSGVNALKVFIK